MLIKEAFLHCPRCRSEFISKESYLECPSCGLHHYLNPKPCTAILIHNERGEYLLVKRASEPKKDWWDLPGGFLETGETFEEAAIREVKEELGIDIKDLTYIGSSVDTYDYRGVIYDLVGVSFATVINSDEAISPADDVSDYKFLKPVNFPLNEIAFPSTKALLKSVQQPKTKNQ